MLAASNDMMTAQRWLDLWGTTMRQGLEGCKGAPTIIFDSRAIITDIDGSLRKLKAMLERAGVTGLSLPEPDEVQREVKAYIKSGPRSYALRKEVAARTGLGSRPLTDATLPVMTAEQVRLAFSKMHCVAICLIVHSVAACCIVISARRDFDEQQRWSDGHGLSSCRRPWQRR